MSDYKRIVSYMYDYQDGVKRNNVGFARVEAKNDQCKIMINIKAPSLNNNTLKAYIFHRNDDVIVPISIGNISIRNGIGDYKTITRVNDIMYSLNTLDQMCGIIVYFDDDKYFATEWDDKPVILYNFNKEEAILNEKVPILDKEEQSEWGNINTNEMENKKESKKENIKENIKVNIKEDKEEDKEKDKKEDKKYNIVENIKEEIQEVAEEIKKGIEEVIEDIIDEDIKEELNEVIKEVIKEEIEDVSNEDIKEDLGEVTQEETKEEIKNVSEENVKEMLDEKVKEESISSDRNDSKERVRESIHKEDKTELHKEDITSPTAARIFARYTKMFPFEDEEIAECVRIEPQDIGAFPIENWVLGNNSFLLHGYYNYRHLIFARKKSVNGNQYIIGVPGFFQSREKFMAKLFGFEDFKPIKEKESLMGEFGYWYITINI